MEKRNLYIQLVCISLGFVALLKLGSFWKLMLAKSLTDEVEIDLVAGIFTRLPIFILLLYLLKRFGFERFTALNRLRHSQNFQAILLPMVFICGALFSNLTTYAHAGIYLLSAFIINVLLVALIEEITFRGLVLPIITKLRKGKKNRVFVSVVFTALIFGLLHYINLLRQPDNFSGITSQVIFATAIGIFLGGLMLRTRHIFLPVAIHFLINFSFGSGDLKRSANIRIEETAESQGFDEGTLITLLFFLFIAAGGWYMTSKTDTGYFVNKLDFDRDDLTVE